MNRHHRSIGARTRDPAIRSLKPSREPTPVCIRTFHGIATISSLDPSMQWRDCLICIWTINRKQIIYCNHEWNRIYVFLGTLHWIGLISPVELLVESINCVVYFGRGCRKFLNGTLNEIASLSLIERYLDSLSFPHWNFEWDRINLFIWTLNEVAANSLIKLRMKSHPCLYKIVAWNCILLEQWIESPPSLHWSTK